MRNTWFAAWALGLAVAVATALPAGAQNDLQARARALHKQSPVIDGHNDYPWALRERDVGGDFTKADITEPVPSLMTDIPRLRRGGLGASSGRFTCLPRCRGRKPFARRSSRSTSSTA